MHAVDPWVAAGALLAVVAALAIARSARRAPYRAAATHDALGDAVLVLDRAGAIVAANAAAGRLAGVDPAALRGRPIAALGEDLRVLARGLARGPAAGRVEVSAAGAPVRARASLARVASRPARDLVILRRDPAERPPPLPRAADPSAAPPPAPAEARAGILAAAAALAEPLARAARAASLLRLSAPPLPARPAAALAAIEDALEEAERRAAALAAAGQPGRRRPLDLSALVDELVRTAAPPPARGSAARSPRPAPSATSGRCGPRCAR